MTKKYLYCNYSYKKRPALRAGLLMCIGSSKLT